MCERKIDSEFGKEIDEKLRVPCYKGSERVKKELANQLNKKPEATIACEISNQNKGD